MLRTNFAWTFLGNVVYAACQWGVLAILAKFGSLEMVGQFALGLAVAGPVMVFSQLQLRAVQATDACHRYDFVDYLGLRLVTTTIAMAIIVGMVVVSQYAWNVVSVILAVTLFTAADTFSDLIYGLLQQHERMDRIAQSMMLKGPLFLVTLIAILSFGGHVVAGILGMAVSKLVIFAAYDVPNAVWVLRHADSPGTGVSAQFSLAEYRKKVSTLVSLARLSLPLGVTAMLISLNGSIPRYFTEYYLGDRELGLFAGIGYLMVVGSTVVCALGNSASARLARYHDAGDARQFSSLMTKLMGLAVLLGVIGVAAAMIAGGEILTIVYRAEYATYKDVLVVVMVASALWYVASMFGFGATACRRLAYQPVILTGVALVSLVSCWVLIPRWGLLGASFSMVAASGVGALCYGLLLRRG